LQKRKQKQVIEKSSISDVLDRQIDLAVLNSLRQM